MIIIQPATIPIVVQSVMYELTNGIVTSARLGLRKLSPSSAAAWTTIATIVAIESASCATRRSGPRPFSSLPPMSRPAPTPTLENSSASVPAARLVIQKRWSLTAAASIGLGLARGDRRRPGVGALRGAARRRAAAGAVARRGAAAGAAARRGAAAGAAARRGAGPG